MVPKNGDRAERIVSAHRLSHPYRGVLHLTFAGFTAQLRYGFADDADACRTSGMPQADAAAVCVRWACSAQGGFACGYRARGLAAREEAQPLQMQRPH